MALVWVLLSFHCKFEALPGFEFLRCAAEHQATAQSGAGGDPCDDSGCCTVESAQFRAPRQHEHLPVIVLAIVPAHHFGCLEPVLPEADCRGVLVAAPPELPAPWQFLSRTALPVRAPSLAS